MDWPDDGSPYIARSPTLKRRITYTPEEIWAEVARIDDERGREYTLGQSLYYQVGYFAHPFFFWRDWIDEVIEDFRVSTALGVPLAPTVGELPAFRAADFIVIQEELAAIRALRARMKAKG